MITINKVRKVNDDLEQFYNSNCYKDMLKNSWVNENGDICLPDDYEYTGEDA